MHVTRTWNRCRGGTISGQGICRGISACLLTRFIPVQAGPEVLIGLQQEAAEVRSQMSALKEEAGTLAGQVEPAVAALLAANPPYQPPPHTDKVID